MKHIRLKSRIFTVFEVPETIEEKLELTNNLPINWLEAKYGLNVPDVWTDITDNTIKVNREGGSAASWLRTGDWIIRDINNRYYGCSKELFGAIAEEVQVETLEIKN